jgi:K+-transporting ATPase ATPase B chain
VVILVALFVTLIPTTIGALLSAIGIAGMDRLVRFNVLAMSGRAVEAAGDVDTLLLDKTGTITLGNRRRPSSCRAGRHRAGTGRRGAAASLPTRRRRAARSSCWPRRNTASAAATWRRTGAKFIPFTAQTRMSGVDVGAGRSARARSMRSSPMSARRRQARHTPAPARVRSPTRSSAIARSPNRRRPLAVAKDGKLLGVIHLKDIVKGGIRERFAELRRWASAP